MNSALGQIVIVSLASLHARNLSTQPHKISCLAYEADGVAWCGAAATIYVIMTGYSENTCLQPVYT
jgi:hypothetical protein